MPNPSPNTQGLLSNSKQALDAFEKTVPISGRIEQSNAEWLKTLPDGISYHLRQAVKLYKKALCDQLED